MAGVLLIVFVGIAAALIGARSVAHERHGRDNSEDLQ